MREYTLIRILKFKDARQPGLWNSISGSSSFTHSHASFYGKTKEQENIQEMENQNTYVKMEAITFGWKCGTVRSEVDKSPLDPEVWSKDFHNSGKLLHPLF